MTTHRDRPLVKFKERGLSTGSPYRRSPVEYANVVPPAARDDRSPMGVDADRLLSELQRLQDVNGSGSEEARSRHVVTRTHTTTERMVFESDTSSRSASAGSMGEEPWFSFVCRQMLGVVFALMAVACGTGCLFAITNSSLSAFFVFMVLGVSLAFCSRFFSKYEHA